MCDIEVNIYDCLQHQTYTGNINTVRTWSIESNKKHTITLRYYPKNPHISYTTVDNDGNIYMPRITLLHPSFDMSQSEIEA